MKNCSAGQFVKVQYACLVYVLGTAFRNVKCDRCPKGTFSNTVSNTDWCQPHTEWVGVIYLHARRDCFRDYPSNSPLSWPVSCVGRGVVSQGNATADAMCGPEAVVSGTKRQTTTKEPRGEIQLTTASPTTTVTDLVPESTVDVLPSVTPLPRQTKLWDEEGTANYSLHPIGSIMKNLLSVQLFFKKIIIMIIICISFSICLPCVSVSVFASVVCLCWFCCSTHFADCCLCSAMSKENGSGERYLHAAQCITMEMLWYL